ncbi:BglG family transcription antiterminator [Enterococcus alishanensis]
MSKKGNREKQLLLYLSNKSDFVTGEEIAKHFNISPKTVYRLVKKINDEVTDDIMIFSEKGRGFKLNYEKYLGNPVAKSEKQIDFTPKQRRERVLEALLLAAPHPKKIYELFDEYYVGDSVVASDEQILTNELAQYDLVLERKNRQLAIVGEEKNIRKAIGDVIQNMNIVDIEELRNNQSLNFNSYDVLYILDQLRKMKLQIPYPYNVNIFSHLYILVSRSRKSSQIVKREVTAEEEQEMVKDPELKKIAETVIDNISKYINEPLPENEIYHLYQYLVSSRIEGNNKKNNHFSDKVNDVTYFYLEEMTKRLGIAMVNEIFFNDFANHIKPMLNRLENQIRVKNGLLDQIKSVYDNIFQQVTEVSALASQKFQLATINDDENGFITLYFARVLETDRRPIPTLIMCTTGIGTSELLRVKIAKKFPELEIVDVLATRDYDQSSQDYAGVELILSTIDLNQQVSINNLLVSAMFSKEDEERLKNKIEEIYHERK